MTREDDPRQHFDTLRPQHPVARFDNEWYILGHPEVVAAATDDQRFSSAVSRHLQLPNGLDGDEHRRFRSLVDRYLSHDRMEGLAPVFDEVARRLVDRLPIGEPLDAVESIGAAFAVAAMTAWLGWPETLHDRLLRWVADNKAATASGDQLRTAAVAEDFDAILRTVIAPRRAEPRYDDVTAQLVRDESLGRALRDDEVVSILRNWTGGDLSSMALCIGVVVAGCARDAQVADRLRSCTDAEADAIINEWLRLDDPFVSNRRVTTCPVTLGGSELPVGARVRIHWASANRDQRVFADAFQPDTHEQDNVVFGVGAHACPGKELTLLELRTITRALLARCSSVELVGSGVRAAWPAGGFEELPVVLHA